MSNNNNNKQATICSLHSLSHLYFVILGLSFESCINVGNKDVGYGLETRLPPFAISNFHKSCTDISTCDRIVSAKFLVNGIHSPL
mmetsp:Transcript_35736/g.39835  ORF Transcript_35736/g.39835 Transcript_35736/m.39835 type:complete len:85 (-) Transcript_35736:1673-1927(-)